MPDIPMNVTRPPDVLHQEDAVRPQGPVDPGEDPEGPGLVVDRVEGGDEIVGGRLGGLVEIAQIPRDEFDVPEPLLARLGPRGGDRLPREVESGEAAGREE